MVAVQRGIETGQITAAEAFPVFVRRLNAMPAKEIGHDRFVAPAGEGHLRVELRNIEILCQGLSERLLASAASENERAVDIEQAEVHEWLRVEG